MKTLYLTLTALCIVNIAYWSFSEYIRGGDAINGLIEGAAITLMCLVIGGLFIPLMAKVFGASKI